MVDVPAVQPAVDIAGLKEEEETAPVDLAGLRASQVPDSQYAGLFVCRWANSYD
jgi:hypothetical protein